MQIKKLSSGDAAEFLRERPGCSAAFVIEKSFCQAVPERFNHVPKLSEIDNFVNDGKVIEA